MILNEEGGGGSLYNLTMVCLKVLPKETMILKNKIFICNFFFFFGVLAKIVKNYHNYFLYKCV